MCFAYADINPHVVPPILIEIMDAEAWRWTLQPLVDTIEEKKKDLTCGILMWLTIPCMSCLLCYTYQSDLGNSMKWHGEKQCREGNWKFYDERPVFRWENGHLYVDVEMITATNVVVAHAVQQGIGGVFMGGGGVFIG